MGSRGASSSSVAPTGGGGKYGIGVQGTDKSIDSAMNIANEDRNKGDGYDKNCQRSVAAYELLRQGYNVVAKPATKDINTDIMMQNENWRHIFQGQTWDKIRGKNVEQTIINKMRSYGEESRAMLYFEWNDGGAHVINVERRKSGEVLYVDSQDGKLVPAAMLFVSAKSFELSNVKDKKPTKLIEYCVKKRS